MAWLPTAVLLPGESHGQRSLEGYSPWGCKESDPTEGLSLTQVIISQGMCISSIKLYTLNICTLYAKVISTKLLKIVDRDFPGGPVVKSLPASAGVTGSIPGPGGFQVCAVEQRDPRAPTTEPACSRVRALQ